MSALTKRLRERITAKKMRLDHYRPLPPSVVANLREELIVEYTHSSNAIEGNTLTLGETRMVIEDGVTIGGKSIREHLEATNHPKAIAFIEELADGGREFTEEDILKLHGIILSGIDQSAGSYRRWGVRIAGSTFSPPPSVEVPQRMTALIKWFGKNPEELPPIELATALMHRLVQIHPFADGNGRVARLLMNLTLIRSGYPFIINISYRDRAKYLRALQEADEGNVKPLAGLVARSVEAALDNYLRVIEEPKALSFAEAEAKYGIDANYLGLLARRGILPAFKHGGRWSVFEEELVTYLTTVRRRKQTKS